MHRAPHGAQSLKVLDDETRCMYDDETRYMYDGVVKEKALGLILVCADLKWMPWIMSVLFPIVFSSPFSHRSHALVVYLHEQVHKFFHVGKKGNLSDAL